jgi:hypothetical protein
MFIDGISARCAKTRGYRIKKSGRKGDAAFGQI